MMDQGAVRNLEQIQEQDHSAHMPRASSAIIVVLGGACVVFAALALGGRRSAPAAVAADPLGDLVAQHPHGAQGASGHLTDLRPSDVTFPSMLSDDKNPPTALAAVRSMPALGASPAAGDVLGPRAGAGSPESGYTSSPVPPPPTDRLSVMPVPAQPPPLPAQNVLEATPVITRPRDGLTKAASDSAQLVTAAAPTTPAGHEGGYQLQVSSFRTQQEANDFADQLRARSHKAYVQEAHVAGRGTWFRVRVGPFPTQHAASAYRSTFEAKEHVVPFIVPPSVKDATPTSPVGTH